LKFYGIIGRARQLIKSYLEDRFQRVETVSNVFRNTTTSDWVKTHMVSLRNLFLDLTLFDIYYWLSPDINNSVTVLFTDDTSIIVNNSYPIYIQTNIKEVFKHLNKWFSLNVL
jgi:hypothetical protein